MLVISGKDFLQAGPKRGAKVSMRVCRRGVGDSGFKVLCGWISHFWRRRGIRILKALHPKP